MKKDRTAIIIGISTGLSLAIVFYMLYENILLALSIALSLGFGLGIALDLDGQDKDED